MRHSKDALKLAEKYADTMKACAAYVSVNRPAVREPGAVYGLVRPLMDAATGDTQEVFMVILLNTKNRPIGIPRECTRGLLDTSPVHPREIFRDAVRECASSIVLAHNHPSGDPTPSKEDVDITRRLIESSRILGIRVVDHVVCGRPTETNPGYVSLREKNLIAFD